MYYETDFSEFPEDYVFPPSEATDGRKEVIVDADGKHSIRCYGLKTTEWREDYVPPKPISGGPLAGQSLSIGEVAAQGLLADDSLVGSFQFANAWLAWHDAVVPNVPDDGKYHWTVSNAYPRARIAVPGYTVPFNQSNFQAIIFKLNKIDGYVQIIRFYSTSLTYLCTARITPSGITISLSQVGEYSVSIPISLNDKHFLQVEYIVDAANGGVRVWFDDDETPVLEQLGLDTTRGGSVSALTQYNPITGVVLCGTYPNPEIDLQVYNYWVSEEKINIPSEEPDENNPIIKFTEKWDTQNLGDWIIWTGSGYDPNPPPTGVGRWGADITGPAIIKIVEIDGKRYAKVQNSKEAIGNELALDDQNKDNLTPTHYDLVMSASHLYGEYLVDKIKYIDFEFKLLDLPPKQYAKIFHWGRYTGRAIQRFSVNVTNTGALSFAELYHNNARLSESSGITLELNKLYKMRLYMREKNDGKGFYKAFLDDVVVLDKQNLNNYPSAVPDGETISTQFEIGEDYFGEGTVDGKFNILLGEINVGYVNENGGGNGVARRGAPSTSGIKTINLVSGQEETTLNFSTPMEAEYNATISIPGSLVFTNDGEALANRSIDIFENGIKVTTVTTDIDGEFVFNGTMPASGASIDYRADFAGDP
jgi:hypothetical protein